MQTACRKCCMSQQIKYIRIVNQQHMTGVKNGKSFTWCRWIVQWPWPGEKISPVFKEQKHTEYIFTAERLKIKEIKKDSWIFTLDHLPIQGRQLFVVSLDSDNSSKNGHSNNDIHKKKIVEIKLNNKCCLNGETM